MVLELFNDLWPHMVEGFSFSVKVTLVVWLLRRGGFFK